MQSSSAKVVECHSDLKNYICNDLHILSINILSIIAVAMIPVADDYYSFAVLLSPTIIER